MNEKRQQSKQRAAILDAAIRVFGDHGWKGATTRMVGRAAGVNSALIYYYFADKQTLFREALQLVLHGFLERLRGPGRPPAGARGRIAFLVDTICDYYRDHPERMRLMTLALTQHPDLFAGALSAFFRTGTDLVPLRLLEEGMREGELRRVDPLGAWWSILSLCLFGLQLNGVFARLALPARVGALPTETARRQLTIDLLERGLAAGRRPRRKE